MIHVRDILGYRLGTYQGNLMDIFHKYFIFNNVFVVNLEFQELLRILGDYAYFAWCHE